MGETRRGPVFKAERDQHVAYAEQGDATLSATITNVDEPTNVAVLTELRALREGLGRFAPKAAASMEAAEKEATKPEPRLDQVMSHVETAVKLAASANGFAEQADKLIPHLQQVATWAGRTWDAWRPTLGL